jgi:hypothetical protein
MPTIGWSDFAIKFCHRDSGKTYTTLSQEEVIARIKAAWDARIPGNGETGLDRKILVPVQPDGFFCPPRVELVEGLPVQAQITCRQQGEDLYVETFVTPEDVARLGLNCEVPAKRCDVVLYSAEALLENNGTRTTDCEWEIVCLLARATDEPESMSPLTMARNFLNMPGGTKSVYTAEQFARAIYDGSKKSVQVKRPENRGTD